MGRMGDMMKGMDMKQPMMGDIMKGDFMKGMDLGPNAVCNSQSYSYSSNQGPDGKPHVVQSSSQMRRAGNVAEMKQKHSDSKSGLERMALQRKLGDRGRKVERSRNMHKPNEDHTNDVCVGMDASYGQQFNQEWEEAAGRAGLPGTGGRAGGGRLGYQPQVSMGNGRTRHALPSSRNAGGMPAHIQPGSQRGRGGGGRDRRNSDAPQAIGNGPPSIATVRR